LCQDDVCLPEPVRTIHLNPIRARRLGDLDELDGYAYSGHSALIGKVKQPWQDTQGVPALFGKNRVIS
jgi:hypothetical protein